MEDCKHRDGFVKKCYWEIKADRAMFVAHGGILRTVILYGKNSDSKQALFRMLRGDERFEHVAVIIGPEGEPRIDKSLLDGVYLIDMDSLFREYRTNLRVL